MTQGSGAAGRIVLPITVAGWCLVLGLFVLVGADTLWAVAMGDAVLRTGDLHPAVPFVASIEPGWSSPLALGEVVLALADRVAPFGLAALQVLLLAVALAVTGREAVRWGASAPRAALAVSLLVVGGLAAFVIVRLPSLSLVPFVLLAALLRRQHERPTAAIWWAVALLAFWANLHGGVLLGAALLGAHVLGSRLRGRPAESAALAVGAALALCATPALWRTPAYYIGVFGNEAARRGSDLWARPSLTHPLDVLLLASALVLLVLALRRRPPLWEVLALAGLAIGTALAARNGIWLLLLAAPSIGRSATANAEASGLRPRATLATVLVATVLGVVALVPRGERVHAPGDSVVGAIRTLAAGRTVLATEPLAETLAARGVRVWAGNPIDAFPRATQVALLDFLHDGTLDEAAMRDVQVVVAPDGSATATALEGEPGWTRSAVPGYVVLERAP